ncbi:MAG TPA: 3-oxoacyl-[acyl-carrier-protein] synthase III C-terminal domain-containing protein [Verrucomicrobiae bacterium]|jgi:alkylresorcinol/alkylpyrone synthase
MFIAGLGTATPSQRYTQRQCWDALQKSARVARLKPRSRAILKKVLCGDNGIAARHLSLKPISDVFEMTPDVLQARFTEHAPALAVSAAKRALRNAAVAAKTIDAVLISTCTGYLCPGLTSYVSEQLGLRENVFALDLVGQGCGAALPNLRTADAILAAGRAENVLSICVEVCSAAFFLDDDPGVLVSACLFGDGAGAAVLTHQPNPHARRVEWKFSASHLTPGKRDTLRFGHKDGMLRNILSPQVPQIAGVAAAKLFSETIAEAGVRRDKVSGWVMHTGGRDVLLALRERLKLKESDLRHSAAILREFGNISSPTVFFVLERALQDAVPNGYWWMSSFGAGFSCHGALLEVK